MDVNAVLVAICICKCSGIFACAKIASNPGTKTVPPPIPRSPAKKPANKPMDTYNKKNI
jgi:hypothetical protein